MSQSAKSQDNLRPSTGCRLLLLLHPRRRQTATCPTAMPAAGTLRPVWDWEAWRWRRPVVPPRHWCRLHIGIKPSTPPPLPPPPLPPFPSGINVASTMAHSCPLARKMRLMISLGHTYVDNNTAPRTRTGSLASLDVPPRHHRCIADRSGSGGWMSFEQISCSRVRC